MEKPKIIILGKVPPPFMGTAIWFNTLKHSEINDEFDIQWFNVNVQEDFSITGKHVILKIWPNISLYLRFWKLIHHFRPMLILIPISQSTQGFIKDSVFIRLARRKAKTLIMLHGSNLQGWLNNSRLWMRNYFGKCMVRVSGAIVLGDNLKGIFKPWFDESRIFSVPNGVDLDFNGIQKTSSKKIILRYLSNLYASKGISDLLEAINHLDKDRVELRVNGAWLESETESRCRKMVSDNNLPVIFEGIVTGQEKLIALVNSDIFIFPPKEPEGHPFVIIEAMAAGLPIITTDQGAISEIVIDERNGFIVRANYPEDIAEKIRFLIENPAERKKMGEESRRIYKEWFTEQKMVQRLSKVFNTILRD